MPRILSIATAAILLGIVIVLSATAWFYFGFIQAPVGSDAPVSLQVQRGDSFYRVSTQLTDSGIISNRKLFSLLGRLTENSNRIKAGTYLFDRPLTPLQVLNKLTAGDFQRVSLTVPEGFSCEEISLRIAEAGLGEAEIFEELCLNPPEHIAAELTYNSLEGYLFPETYIFNVGSTEIDIIEAMYSHNRSRLNDLLAENPLPNGFDEHQLMTLAAIIQKEAGDVGEMPLISSVFHNRLKRGMPLQADPTVIYGIVNFDGNITRKHLRTPTPFNTYTNKGLPPGPICNPGDDAIIAAIHPAVSKALYFVARGDGTHIFANNLRDHNANVRKFQLKR